MTDLVNKKECKMFPLGLTCGKNSFSPSSTLSDLLKQSGIKECKSKKNKKPGDMKKKTKYYYEKYMKNGYEATINRIQELKNPPKNLLSPIERESSEEGFPIDEVVSKKSVDSKNNESENEEILVSLNFIDDCQKYKKRKFGDENRVGNYTKYVEKYQNSRLKKLQKSESGSQKTSIEVDIQLCKDKQNDEYEDFQTKGRESFLEWTLRDESGKIFSDAPVVRRKPSVKPSPDDISTIDRNYLESLLSLTKRTQCRLTPLWYTDDEKNDDALDDESLVLKKKKKNFHQETPKKTDKNKLHAENLGKAKESPLNVLENLPKLSREKEVLPTVFRNLTKSDQQVKTNVNSPALKTEKQGTYSKPIINDIRKKRTPRNKAMKNEADTFIETSIPGEVLNTDMVQELWTRSSKKNSDNSLTSTSSTYAPDIDDIRNLDSYKCLSKYVQDEIAQIVNKSGAKPPRGTEKSKSSAEAPEKSKDIRKKLQNSLHGNSSEIFQSEAKSPLHKKKQPNSQLPAFFPDDIPKEVNCSSLLKKKTKDEEQLPSKVIENWSIMNRLEQAFLALVTPTFQDKKKKTATPPRTPNSVKEGSQRSQTTDKTVTKKPVKTKNVPMKKDIRPDSSETKNILPTATRTPQSPHNKKIQNEKTNALNEKHGGNEQKKNPKQQQQQQQLQVNYLMVSKNTESNIKTKRKKKTPIEQNQSLLEGKIYKKDGRTNPTKLPRVLPIPVRTEPSDISLEGKSTFSIIKLSSSKNIIHRPRKSKGCNKSDGNIKICYLKTTNKESQLTSEHNLIGQPKLSKSNGDEEGIKSTNTHKKLTKTSLNTEPSPERETPKNSEEKTSLKENLEKTGVVQQKETERTEEIRPNTSQKEKEYDRSPVQSIPVLKINSSSTNNGKVRAVKKRSILSVHANQICNDPPLLQQIQEKDGMDICVLNPNVSEQGYMRDLNTSQITVIITNSNTSITSTTTYINECHQNCPSETGTHTVVPTAQESSDTSPEWCSDTMFSSVSECRTLASECRTLPSESIFEQSTPRKETWERDLSHYHQIVREIMSQYNRIDGLLKQSEKMNTLASEGTVNTAKSDAQSKLTSLREYRKRIISEYEALPNYEYKSKILENTGGNLSLEEAKRNLAVVKDSETYEDEDVKDHYPKMKKILDSQLYVEPENLVQRVEPKEKIIPKNSSLQDVYSPKNRDLCNIMSERLKSFSTKIFPPPFSRITLCGSQGTSSKESCLEYLSSLSGLDYFVQSETETETS